MKKRFLARAAELGFWTVILRLLSMGFGVWLSNRVGAEGTGLYQLVLSVYLLAVTFSTSGVTIAVCRIVSEQFTQNNRAGMIRALRLGLTFAAVLGLLAAFFLYGIAPFAAEYWLCDSRTAAPLRIFAFALPFLSTASVIRGYFLGRQRTFFSVSGDLVEQLVTMAVTVWLVGFFLPKGIEGACLAMVIGSASAEIVSCLFAAMLCLFDRVKGEGRAPRGMGKRILKITFPVAIGNNVRAALSTIENILTPLGLRQYGASSAAALAQYGVVKGMAWPILMLPTVLLSPISSLLVPEIAAASAQHNTTRVQAITHRCIQSALLYAFLAAGLLYTFAEPLGAALFADTPECGGYIRLLCPLLPLLYLDQIVDSILKGLDQQVASMRYNMADAAIRMTLVYFLVPRYGIGGWLFMFYVGTIFNASLSVMRLIKVSRVEPDIFRWIVLPLGVSILSSCLAGLFSANMIVGIVVYVCFYAAFLCFYHVMPQKIGFSKKIEKNFKKNENNA